MIRKFAIAAAAVAALGTASLAASTPAAAWGKGGGGGGFHHFHGGGLRIYSGVGLLDYDSCYRTRTFINRRGEVVQRVVNVCL